eukprot:jgi/Pico_ML_1/53823/g4298.t1
MQEVELEPYWLDMKVSFGVGELRWNNYEETPIIVELRDEIKKFGKLLKKIKRFEPIFAFVPISKLMKWFRFSDSFSQNIVFPLTALFFGTGNQTPNVSSAIFARVFNDDNLRLYNYDPELFLASAPRMFAFPRLSDMYTRMQKQTEARSGGLAVAHRLGAPYPFADDKLACLQFEVYLGLIHGRRYEPDSKETEHPA